MINGFEEETADLNYKEKLLLPRFIEGLKRRKGKANAITSAEMERKLKQEGIKCTGPRIRKIINHIRLNGMVPRLLATSGGYYVSDSPPEIEEYIESLDQRIGAISAVRDALKYQFENMKSEGVA